MKSHCFRLFVACLLHIAVRSCADVLSRAVLWLQGVFLANQLTATGTDGPFGLKVGLWMQAVFRILYGGMTNACLDDTNSASVSWCMWLLA